MKIMRKFLITLILTVLIMSPVLIMAVDEGEGGVAGGGEGDVSIIANPLKANTVSELLVNILDLITQIGVVVVTMGIIYAGFLYATARGNKDKVSKAHEAFYWTIVGSAIVLGAFAITKVVSDTAQAVLGS
jgi:hypothetical protein